MEQFDVVIVGAGMAGASLAWALAPRRRVLVLERESQPGYHSTGRSAATLHSSYGNRTIRALTAASAPFYRDPPPGFAEAPLCPPARGAEGRARGPARRSWSEELETHAPVRASGAAARCRPPAWRWSRPCAPTTSPAALLDPTMLDLDVAAILAGFLRGARARGAVAAHLGADRRPSSGRPAAGGSRLRDGDVGGPVLVDAAGAWADQVARMAGPAAPGHRPPPPHGHPRRRHRGLPTAAAGRCSRRRRRGLVRQAGRRPAAVLARGRDALAALRRPARGARRRDLRRADRGGVRVPDPPDREPLGRPALLRRRPDPGRRLRPARRGLLLARRPGRLRHPDGTGAGGAGRGRDTGRSPAGPAAGADIDPGSLAPARLLRLAGDAGQSLASG